MDGLTFSPPTEVVYNPLDYARHPIERYLKRFARRGVKALFLGMNPGPWGMAQTGVPFGEVDLVKRWMGIDEPVGRPTTEHPKRPIQGFDCERSEVSGRRLWGWAEQSFGPPEAFFEHYFVWNYCPLVFMEASGKNRTPDKLPAEERDALFDICDSALRRFVECLAPERVIGVGKFAEKRAQLALGLGEDGPSIHTVLHPSPASPIANRGWAAQAEQQLAALGLPIA